MPDDNTAEDGLTWHDLDTAPFRISGLAWVEQDCVFRRLPVSAAESIRPDVDGLANQTAGGQVAFRSNTTRLAVKVELTEPAGMDHMSATGQCGCDLYLGDPLQQHFQSVVRYDITQDHYENVLFEHPDEVMRSFTINLPLYQGIKSAQIGLRSSAEIEAPYPWSRPGPVVVYGTSITQGGCASRPGMAHTNILSRALNMAFINLGFSGNGSGEPEVIRYMAEVPDARLFILEYEASSWIDGLQETMPVAIDLLRERHAHVPILIVSRIPFSKDRTHRGDLKHREQCRDYQAQIVKERFAAGDTNIHFMDGSRLLEPAGEECTVDGVHPNDLGFSRMAENMYPLIKRLSDRA